MSTDDTIAQGMASTLHISEANLRHNVEAVRSILGDTALLAVIKADGYGHSATLVAPMFARNGVPWLGVTDAREGAAVREALRAAGFSDTPRILMMTSPPGDREGAMEAATLTLQHDLTPTVFTPEQLGPLEEVASRSPITIPVHLEVDTGMSRQGAAPGAALEAFLAALAPLARLRLDGVSTHLASAECVNAVQTIDQMHAFRAALYAVHAREFMPPWLHAGNTSTLDNASKAAWPTIPDVERLARESRAEALVRCGLALYGLCLPLEPDSPFDERLRPELKPVLTWTTTITAIQDIPTGAKIGYSATYTAQAPMRLALLPIGYADGLRRGLSSTNATPGGWVMIAGQRAPIVGKISMNLTTVDVSHIHPAPHTGDPVTLLGPGITAEDHARLAHCLPYEILCGLRGTHSALPPPAPAR